MSNCFVPPWYTKRSPQGFCPWLFLEFLSQLVSLSLQMFTIQASSQVLPFSGYFRTGLASPPGPVAPFFFPSSCPLGADGAPLIPFSITSMCWRRSQTVAGWRPSGFFCRLSPPDRKRFQSGAREVIFPCCKWEVRLASSPSFLEAKTFLRLPLNPLSVHHSAPV